jgi:hypothetical protein
MSLRGESTSATEGRERRPGQSSCFARYNGYMYRCHTPIPIDASYQKEINSAVTVEIRLSERHGANGSGPLFRAHLRFPSSRAPMSEGLAGSPDSFIR